MTWPEIATWTHAVRACTPSQGGVRLVLIDGPAGAGKTTLARHLAAELGGAPVLHADDMYEGWDGLDGLAEILVPQVLEPLAAGRPAAFRRWDWHRDRRGATVTTTPAPVMVVEGVGVGQARARPHASVLLWVDAPAELRHQRWLEREGADTELQWRRWREAERTHFAREDTRAAADLVIDGAIDLARTDDTVTR